MQTNEWPLFICFLSRARHKFKGIVYIILAFYFYDDVVAWSRLCKPRHRVVLDVKEKKNAFGYKIITCKCYLFAKWWRWKYWQERASYAIFSLSSFELVCKIPIISVIWCEFINKSESGQLASFIMIHFYSDTIFLFLITI